MADNFVNFIDMRYQNGKPWVILGAIGEGADVLDQAVASKIIALTEDGDGLYSCDGGCTFYDVDMRAMSYTVKRWERHWWQRKCRRIKLPSWAIAELDRMIEANRGRPPAMTG